MSLVLARSHLMQRRRKWLVHLPCGSEALTRSLLLMCLTLWLSLGPCVVLRFGSLRIHVSSRKLARSVMMCNLVRWLAHLLWNVFFRGSFSTLGLSASLAHSRHMGFLVHWLAPSLWSFSSNGSLTANVYLASWLTRLLWVIKRHGSLNYGGASQSLALSATLWCHLKWIARRTCCIRGVGSLSLCGRHGAWLAQQF